MIHYIFSASQYVYISINQLDALNFSASQYIYLNINQLDALNFSASKYIYFIINPLTPNDPSNDPYMGRTAPLTSKHCILHIYSTNIGTEYFKQPLYCPFFLFKMRFIS